MIRKTRRFYFLTFVLFSLLRGGTELTNSTVQLYSYGTTANLVSTYYNEYTSGVSIVFTPADDYDNLKIYAELSSGAVGGCTESNFDGTELNFSGATFDGVSVGDVVTLDQIGTFSQSSHTLTIPAARILERVGGTWTEGYRLYLAIKFDGSNSKWHCPRTSPSAGVTASAPDGTRHYFKVDRTDPSLAS